MTNREYIELCRKSLSVQLENIMDYKKPRVHFVRSIDIYNTGDMSCGPLDYFPVFKEKFNCYLHSSKNMEYSLIRDGDVVIIGGGGLLECGETHQNAINRLLSMPVKVISWALGHNSAYQGNMWEWNVDREIDYSKFYKFTTRDYGLDGMRFLPCVSCMNPGLDMKLDMKLNVKRGIGIIEHHDLHIDEFDYDKINNSDSYEKIINFIASSDVIITNTYHCAYWAMLMCKKVILYKPFSNRFEHFKYKPVVYSGDLEKDIEKCVIYPDALSEFRKMNIEFANEVVSEI